MVPIPDEVHFADLDEFHRRQRDPLVVSPVNADPTVFGAGLAREESPVEVTLTPLAAHNLVNGDGLQTGHSQSHTEY